MWDVATAEALPLGRGYGGGLTPLIDADGKPIVTKDGYKK